MDDRSKQSGADGEGTDQPSPWDMLYPGAALLALAAGIWLVTWHYDWLSDLRVQIAVAVGALALLGLGAYSFARQWKDGFVFDRRNYHDGSRLRWRSRIARDRDRSP